MFPELEIAFLCILWSGIIYGNGSTESTAHRCFCKLKDNVDDCPCPITNADAFNNHKIVPILSSLLKRDYFKFYRVNLLKKCPFWPDDSRCALKDCHVKNCKDSDLPNGLKEAGEGHGSAAEKSHSAKECHKANPTASTPPCPNVKCDRKPTRNGNNGREDSTKDGNNDDNHGGLGVIDKTTTAADRLAFEQWSAHDDAQNNFCELDDDRTGRMEFVDLLKNPERFTGYTGHSPHRIWSSIYNENCFNEHHGLDDDATNGGGKPRSSLSVASKLMRAISKASCFEKRVFYRLISGLHTSISIHLSSIYLAKESANFGMGTPRWSHNVREFVRRFDSRFEPDGPQRLKNLYFTYLVELRALAKVAPYLDDEQFYTGEDEVDRATREEVRVLLEVVRSFPSHFDESKLFRGKAELANQLKREFRLHFRNISRIMDCVGCDKCKLWADYLKGRGWPVRFCVHTTLCACQVASAAPPSAGPSSPPGRTAPPRTGGLAVR